ncbi:MAG: replication restart helicase PriA [Christensenellales bacterium]|jgi:primosomal protein N' (replication factor Y)
MSAYCDVCVDIAVEATDRLYTYALPKNTDISPGTRVLVPFGSRNVEGIVINLKDEAGIDASKIKSVIRPLEDYPIILPHILELAKEIAEKSHSTLSLVLRLMAPAQMRKGRIKPKKLKAAQILVSGADFFKAREAQRRAPKRELLMDLLSDGEVHFVKDLKMLVSNPMPALKRLEQDGIASIFEKEVYRSPLLHMPEKTEDPELTPQQQEAMSEIVPAIAKGSGAFLLHGVTGSGKTEVYIRAVKYALKLNKTAIVLVPEIILTPQIVSWFMSRFGDVAAVLHSGLSAGERYDEWRRLRLGDAKVAIGARSAVFAPLKNLGIIIVDEEHEQTYISENNPRYDARDVALSRCKREGAVLLLASATPSITSFAKAGRGDYMLLEMPERVNMHPLPKVHIVDMRDELRLGNTGMFSNLLIEKLSSCIESGKQAMLFVNRRGYAPSVVCRKCGERLHCKQCDVALTYHASDGRLHCHYCGLSIAFPKVCPNCGSKYLKTCGVGTQKVEEEVKRLFPNVSTVRIDIDTTRGKNGHRKLLNRFRSGEARVMIGTQMIAKGLDFPQVTLVGAVLADLSLNLPDYRSSERTFQLLTQVAGRAGRGEDAGEVVIQTYKPEHYAIQAAKSQDFRSFFDKEFSRRKRDLYPPFTLIVRILCSADTQQEARQLSGHMFSRFKEELQKHPLWKKRVLFYREDDAPIKRIQGKYRAQLFIKTIDNKDIEPMLAFLSELAQEQREKGSAELEINPSTLF